MLGSLTDSQKSGSRYKEFSRTGSGLTLFFLSFFFTTITGSFGPESSVRRSSAGANARGFQDLSLPESFVTRMELDPSCWGPSEYARDVWESGTKCLIQRREVNINHHPI